jgi:undecaprenyl diphosphate synthase
MIIPTHIGIILDGNRRWARSRGLPTFFGHRKGMANVKTIILHAKKVGVKVLTVYAFSTENWNRETKEISYLMKLFELMIGTYLPLLQKEGIKFAHMGTPEKFPISLQNKLAKLTAATKNNTQFTFCACLNYGGRDEIKRAVQKIVHSGTKAEDITTQLISDNLDSAGLPDPDFIIRTSGEQRLSGFLTWQGHYSELYFPTVHWPAFDTKKFDQAIVEFNHRQRRFGK